MPNAIVKPTKMRKNPSPIKYSYWPSQHHSQIIPEEEEEEEVDPIIDRGDQETTQPALDAISAIKKAIGHQNALPTS